MTAQSSSLGFIISQTKQNVEFLASQNLLPSGDVQDIINKLNHSQTALETSMRSPHPPAAPPIPARILFKARATWGYNEDNKEPNDLSFRTGDIIEVTEETNSDWWTGRCKGNTGLFPAAYVSKVIDAPESYNRPSPVPRAQHTPAPVMAPPSFPRAPSPMVPTQMHYPPPPPMQPTYLPPPGPPPMGPPMYTHGPPHPHPGPPPAPAEKPSGLGSSLGNTLAHSAAGGVGFGAGKLLCNLCCLRIRFLIQLSGSAVGSGLINSIF
ncbi:hypothetical protein BKA70DRAFT_224447 [Coprinopsis sp. MPI-PUGE-AT-0042]|nr:hypothetical protein BKA70DRAFT_224447 [Coprinopsis sp. MPI-PUGE-AT-0042]